ncbi:hypothetical protein [Agromyces sp. NPDC049794]|uniref:hypothetical protein n=1 Tax=unclassified Agromyces TaxID=2639701 RepID=UPI0033EEB2FC
MSHREPHAATEPRPGAVMGMRGCERAAECRSDRPGHGLHAMQERLAVTTASKWVDAIVIDIDELGFATLVEFAAGDGNVGGDDAEAAVRRVWHHDGFEGALAPGEPVAIHALYGVLARGRQRFSVADA